MEPREAVWHFTCRTRYIFILQRLDNRESDGGFCMSFLCADTWQTVPLHLDYSLYSMSKSNKNKILGFVQVLKMEMLGILDQSEMPFAARPTPRVPVHTVTFFKNWVWSLGLNWWWESTEFLVPWESSCGQNTASVL